MADNIGPVNIIVGAVNESAVQGMQQVEQQFDRTANHLESRQVNLRLVPEALAERTRRELAESLEAMERGLARQEAAVLASEIRMRETQERAANVFHPDAAAQPIRLADRAISGRAAEPDDDRIVQATTRMRQQLAQEEAASANERDAAFARERATNERRVQDNETTALRRRSAQNRITMQDREFVRNLGEASAMSRQIDAMTDEELATVTGGRGRGGVGGRGGTGRGSNVRQFRYVSQNIGYGFEDALVSYQLSGIQGAARGAGNNLSALATLIPDPVTSGVAIAGIATLTAGIGFLGKAMEDAFKNGADGSKKLLESLSQQLSVVEKLEKVYQQLAKSKDLEGNQKSVDQLRLEEEQAERRMNTFSPLLGSNRQQLGRIEEAERRWWITPWTWESQSELQGGLGGRSALKAGTERDLAINQQGFNEAYQAREAARKERELREAESPGIAARKAAEEQEKAHEKAMKAWQQQNDMMLTLEASALEAGDAAEKRQAIELRSMAASDKLSMDTPADMFAAALGVQRQQMFLDQFDSDETEKAKNRFQDKPFNEAVDIGSRADAEMRQRLMFGSDDGQEARKKRQEIVEELKRAVAELRQIREKTKPPQIPPTAALN